MPALMDHVKDILSGRALDAPRAGREPKVAGLLSGLLLGLGQAYNGQRRTGYIFFAFHIGLAYLYFFLLEFFHESFSGNGLSPQFTSRAFALTVFLGCLVWAFNIYEAVASARRINATPGAAASVPGASLRVFLRTVFWWCISVASVFAAIMFMNVFFMIKR